MAVVNKKKAAKAEKTIDLQIGNAVFTVKPVPAHEVAKANARIQKRVQPVFQLIKKTQRAAAITASRIVLNA